MDMKPYKSSDTLNIDKLNNSKKKDTALSMALESKYTQHNSPKNYGSLQMNSFLLQKPSITIKWNNIEFKTSDGKTLLKGVSGVAHTAELTAIIGPSGAGKSTLLNVLSGFTRQKINGDVLVNGKKCDRGVYRKLCRYIMQEDHLLPQLTTKETLNIAASLKIPTSVNDAEKEKIVEDCMMLFGLMDCKNTRNCNLSGGEKKRVSIAQELLSNPPLIFLDEPTSGLDSLSCIQCIELLKSLAQDGRTVVCTIHQPSSKILEMFDKLYIIAEGTCIYRGPTNELVPFLAAQGLECPKYHNPADFATEVAYGTHGKWIAKLAKATDSIKDEKEKLFFPENCEYQREINRSTTHLVQNEVEGKHPYLMKDILKCGKRYETSHWHQFKILTFRTFKCIMREPLVTHIRFLVYVILGVLIGLLYLNVGNKASKISSNAGCIFFTILFLIFGAISATTLTFSLEKAVFVREHSNCWYSSKMYFLAKTFAEAPFILLFAITFGSIIYWMTSQPPDLFRFGLFLYSSVMVCFVSESFGLTIGAATSMQNAIFMANSLIIPFLLVSGFFIILDNTVLKALSYTSYTRYTYQSILLIIYSMDRKELECDMSPCPFKDPKEIMKSFKLEDESLYLDLFAPWLFLILFKILAYTVLWYKTIRNR